MPTLLPHAALKAVRERGILAKDESDLEYFLTLLYEGELLLKLLVLGVISLIDDERSRHRYRLEYRLARADGIGEWGAVLDDVLLGAATHCITHAGASLRTEFTTKVKSPDWQHKAVTTLSEAAAVVGIPCEEVPTKTDLRRWFALFAHIRNKTKAHGAVPTTKAARSTSLLRESLDHITHNSGMLQLPWAYLHRKMNGAYRVSPICGDPEAFASLRTERTLSLPDGIYLHLSGNRRVPLIISDSDLNDFFVANGSFGSQHYECLSYSSGNRVGGDTSEYQTPPTALPASETHGLDSLDAIGECFTNIPKSPSDYVHRPSLEKELITLLKEGRRPIVTLQGSGGAGKTTLTLRIAHDLCTTGRFGVILWFSGRDIDLLESGIKHVTPAVLTQEDIATAFAGMLPSPTKIGTARDRLQYIQQELTAGSHGPILFVFDNFETFRNPVDVFKWIDTFVRPPNQVLITTRINEFRGDYPVHVPGMEKPEALQLIADIARRHKIEGLVDKEYAEEIYHKADGHPYIIKVLLGEVATRGRRADISQLVIGNQDLLLALFDRTYDAITPAAQRAFLTLASWNSAVPRVVLEAVLIRTIKDREAIAHGIDALLRYSLAEAFNSKDGQEYLRLPSVAYAFGQKKLHVSPAKAAVLSDRDTLMLFGPSDQQDQRLLFGQRLDQCIEKVARSTIGSETMAILEVLETICRSYPRGWLTLSAWQAELPGMEPRIRARKYVERFLESGLPPDEMARGWRALEHLCAANNDIRGQAHAGVERSKCVTLPFFELSAIVQLVNLCFKDEKGSIDADERRHFAEDLAALVKQRIHEADATDLSRMAWLALNLGRDEEARSCVAKGLELDSGNTHCRNLATKLRLS